VFSIRTVARRRVLAALATVVLSCHTSSAGAGSPPLLASIDAAMQDAEQSLRAGDYPHAEHRYAQALAQGWSLMASLETAAGHRAAAREALEHSTAPLGEKSATGGPVTTPPDTARVVALSAAERRALRRDLATRLGRAYLNLGVLAAHGGNFVRAAALLERAAAETPAFPGVQSALGVAYFNAQQYQHATGPLSRAVAAEPANPDLRRMLALAWLNMEAYDKAAALLKDDPQRDTDPSLQYAYGMSLVRSGHADEAQRIFTQLLAAHAGSAQLNVILGEAQAEQGDYPAAMTLLQQALRLDPNTADANAALGTIYFKQGRFAEAEDALRTELRLHPEALRARQMLATVLDLQDKSADAVPLLRGVLASRPDAHDARYLLGKILLAQGHAAEAVTELVEAVRLAPRDASGHYQLAQAYRQLGNNASADEQLALYRTLKDTQRGRRP
jgi:Flp pilus assembly protein TadD